MAQGRCLILKGLDHALGNMVKDEKHILWDYGIPSKENFLETSFHTTPGRKMICDSAGSCDLSVYLKALGMHGHPNNGSAPTVLATETPYVLADNIDSNDGINLADQHQANPSIPLPEEHEDQALNPDGQPLKVTAHTKSEEFSNEDANSLQYAEKKDEELTDVSSCNDPSECRPFEMFQGRPAYSGKFIGNMTDSEDDDRDSNDRIDTASETELDPASHEPDREKHAHKKRKWKALAKGQFERMLLDCIVNTGKHNYKYDFHVVNNVV